MTVGAGRWSTNGSGWGTGAVLGADVASPVSVSTVPGDFLTGSSNTQAEDEGLFSNSSPSTSTPAMGSSTSGWIAEGLRGPTSTGGYSAGSSTAHWICEGLRGLRGRDDFVGVKMPVDVREKLLIGRTSCSRDAGRQLGPAQDEGPVPENAELWWAMDSRP